MDHVSVRFGDDPQTALRLIATYDFLEPGRSINALEQGDIPIALFDKEAAMFFNNVITDIEKCRTVDIETRCIHVRHAQAVIAVVSQLAERLPLSAAMLLALGTRFREIVADDSSILRYKAEIEKDLDALVAKLATTV